LKHQNNQNQKLKKVVYPLCEIPTEERNKKAEDFKMEGNKKKLNDKLYQEAIEFYTKAIAYGTINSNLAIYYSNRAAAYSHLEKFQEALDDCKSSISKKEDYSKAWSRLGLAHFNLGNFQESVKAYERALELEPNNGTIKESLQSAKQKANKTQTPPSTSTSTPSPSHNPAPKPKPQGMPDFSSLLSGLGGGGNGGPGPDLSNLMNDPNFGQMAQQFMNNPQMMNMAQNFMSNPQMMGNLMNMVGKQPPKKEDADDDDAPI